MLKTIAILSFFLFADFAPKSASINIELVLFRSDIVCEVKTYIAPKGKMGFIRLNGDTLSVQIDTATHIRVPKTQLSGTLPIVGDTVLYVGTTVGPALFASLEKNIYRFWSPDVPFSIPYFIYGRPFKGVDERILDKDINLFMSLDGCYLKKKYLKRFIEK